MQMGHKLSNDHDSTREHAEQNHWTMGREMLKILINGNGHPQDGRFHLFRAKQVFSGPQMGRCHLGIST
jgi:hypothetical protein